MSPLGAASIRSQIKKSGILRRSGRRGVREFVTEEDISGIIRYFTHQVKKFRYFTHQGVPTTFHPPTKRLISTLVFPEMTWSGSGSCGFRHFTHHSDVSMVYTPFFDISHTKCRWFTHRLFQKASSLQSLINGYPQRNTLFNTKIFNTRWLRQRLVDKYSAEMTMLPLKARGPTLSDRANRYGPHWSHPFQQPRPELVPLSERRHSEGSGC